MGLGTYEAERVGGDFVERFKAICRMCHGGCGTVVEKVNGTVRRVLGDFSNPVNEGLLCSKAGTPSIEQLYHPDRLDHPLIRTGERGTGQWRKASWDEALTLIAEKMQETKERYGAEAVAFGRGTGVNNTHIVSRLANLFGTPNVISIGYFCYGPRVAVCKVTAAGKYTGKSWDTVAVPDFYSDPQCIVEWGSQKRTSNDHGLIGHKPMTKRAQERACQHRGRPAHAGIGGAGRHLAAAPARHRRGDGARLDAGDGLTRGSTTRSSSTSTATASTSCANGSRNTRSTGWQRSPGALRTRSRRRRGSTPPRSPAASSGATAPTNSATTPSRRRARSWS